MNDADVARTDAPKRYPIGTALRDGKPIITPVPVELVEFERKLEIARVQAEQDRIAKGKLRKERRAAARLKSTHGPS